MGVRIHLQHIRDGEEAIVAWGCSQEVKALRPTPFTEPVSHHPLQARQRFRDSDVVFVADEGVQYFPGVRVVRDPRLIPAWQFDGFWYDDPGREGPRGKRSEWG